MLCRATWGSHIVVVGVLGNGKNHYIGLLQNPEKAGLCGGVLTMMRFPTEIASSLGTGIGQVSYIGLSSNIEG